MGVQDLIFPAKELKETLGRVDDAVLEFIRTVQAYHAMADEVTALVKDVRETLDVVRQSKQEKTHG
jgi:hypothetical protein